MRSVVSICYIDFTGNLETAICDRPISAEELDEGRTVTLFMSSATCPGCRVAIQARIAQLTPAAGPSELVRPAPTSH